MAAFFKPIFILYNFESCFKTCRFLDFLIKLSMFNQKRKTISAVSLFWNHLSADKGKPRRRFSLDPFQPSKGLRPLQTPHDRNHAVPRFMSGGVAQILRDVPAPRLRAEYFVSEILCILFYRLRFPTRFNSIKVQPFSSRGIFKGLRSLNRLRRDRRGAARCFAARKP